MVEQAKNFKVLQIENVELRDKLEKLTLESEKSVAAVLESSNHETVRLEKLLDLRDKELADLKKDFDIQRDLDQAIASELSSLRKEHAQWNHFMLGKISESFLCVVHFSTFFFSRILTFGLFTSPPEYFRLSYF